MLIRLITAISLLIFALLMMSGTHFDMALYRSLIVFLVLFAGFYLTIFFVNVIQESSETQVASSPSVGGKSNGSSSAGPSGSTGKGSSASAGKGSGANSGSTSAGSNTGSNSTTPGKSGSPGTDSESGGEAKSKKT